MRKLFIVLTLFGASILNAQQLNVASYNVRNSNPNDAKAGNGWEQRYPILTQLITFHDFDIFGAQEVKHNQAHLPLFLQNGMLTLLDIYR